METFLAWWSQTGEGEPVNFKLHGYFAVGEDWRHNHSISRLNRKKIMRHIRQERGVNFLHYILQSDKSANDYWGCAALINELLAIDSTGLEGGQVVRFIF